MTNSVKKWYTPQNFSGVPDLMRNFGYSTAKRIEEAHVVVFTGGSDISPRLYGQALHRTTHCWESRDELEVAAFAKAKALGIPMFGICRGAQLLTALNGGSLWQNVTHHGVNHQVYNDKREIMFTTSSCHHQMCRPDPKNTDILGWAYNQTSIFEDDKESRVNDGSFGNEPELMYHHNINALGVQGHPEWMQPTSGFVRWCGDFLGKMEKV